MCHGCAVCVCVFCVVLCWGVYCVCAECSHALRGGWRQDGVYFLRGLFSPDILADLQYVWKEGTQGFSVSPGLTSTLSPYTDYIHEAIRISDLPSFIISVRISIPPA